MATPTTSRHDVVRPGDADRFAVAGTCLAARMLGVVVGALVSEGRVLLVHRSPSKRAHPGRWDLPGGVVEEGESEIGALERELREELGVQVASSSVRHLCRVTVRPADESVLLSAWLVREWTGVPTNAAPDEHDGIGWFDLATMPSLPIEPVQAALLGAVQNDLA